MLRNRKWAKGYLSVHIAQPDHGTGDRQQHRDCKHAEPGSELCAIGPSRCGSPDREPDIVRAIGDNRWQAEGEQEWVGEKGARAHDRIDCSGEDARKDCNEELRHLSAGPLRCEPVTDSRELD